MNVWLLVAFLAMPLLEIYVIVQVGQVIGAWPTVGLLLVESLLGAWIVRREGRRAWRALTQALSSARMPDRELADAGLVLVGGTLLLTPGFVTDVVGFACVLPVTRPLMRRMLAAAVRRRLLASVVRVQRGPAGGAGPRQPPVLPGEVVDRRDERP